MRKTRDTAPDRTIPPLPEPQHRPITEIDARKAKAPARFELTPPGWPRRSNRDAARRVYFHYRLG